MKHGKKDIFIEASEAPTDTTILQKEEEANNFASEFLIPRNAYKELLASKPFTAKRIRAFAQELGIAPGIVVGRLQHARLVEFKQYNALKRRFCFKGEVKPVIIKTDKIALVKRQELDGILEAVCQELELTETQRKSAEEKYNAVGKWLNAGGIIIIYDPDISAQGLIMIGTTVRPIGRIEFDFDLLCKLAKGSRDLGQWYVKNMIGERLREHGTMGKC